MGNLSRIGQASIVGTNERRRAVAAGWDMLPLACQLWQAGKAVSVENAQPRYLRNEVTWKKLPGRD